MQTLELLAVALGMAALAGINLYLTVFATGLAVRLGWLSLAEPYQSLEILADPVILTLSGILFLLEFFADKIPWVDSLWDAVHTVLRPLGAAFLAITVLGETSPAFDVVTGLLAGGMALTTHTFKASTRLAVNASPEPFSNIGLSLLEDFAVLTGLALVAWNPLLALLLAVAAVATVWAILPRLWRLLTSRARFVWCKLTSPASEPGRDSLSRTAPLDVECAIHQFFPEKMRILWVLPATSARIPGCAANINGWLAAVSAESSSPTQPIGRLRFVWAARKFFRLRLFTWESEADTWELKHGFLFDRLIFKDATSGKNRELLIDRATRPIAEMALGEIRSSERQRHHEGDKTSPPNPQLPSPPTIRSE